MSSEAKFVPPFIDPELATQSERLARAKQLKPRKPRENEAGIKLGKALERAGRQIEAEQRKREREEAAAKVRAERFAVASAAKEARESEYDSFEVSGQEESEDKAINKPSGRVVNKHVIRRAANEAEKPQEIISASEAISEPEEIREEDIVVEEVVEPVKVRKQNPELPPVSGEIVTKKKSLIEVARESAAQEAPFLKPETRAALVRAAQEEEDEFIRKNQKFAPKKEKSADKFSTLEKARARVAAMPAAAREKAESTSLVKKLSGKSSKEAIEHISREVARGKQKLLDEIVGRYLRKLGTKENAHKFLMGPEVTGWFKGGQKRDQQNYKKTFKELRG